MIRKILLLFLLFPLIASGTVLSTGTFKTLEKRFGLILENDETSVPWSSEEGIFLIRYLAELPPKLTSEASSIKIIKRSTDISDYLSNNCKEDFSTIHIFSKDEIGKGKDLKKDKSREKFLFLLQNKLIVPYDDRRERKDYLSGIARSVALRYLMRYDSKNKISEKEKWLKISKWSKTAFMKIHIPFTGMTSENVNLKGFAHPSGRISPHNDFVTFGASFFSPPHTLYRESIKCVTPEKYRFFRDLFPDYKAYLDNTEFEKRKITCPSSDTELLSSFEFTDIHTGEKVDLGPVNQKTVKGFELIYATPGDREISEIAGHLMLRVKLDNNSNRFVKENPYDLIIAVLADNKDIQNNKKTKSNVDPCSKDYEKESIQFHELFNSTYEAVLGLTGGFKTIFQIDTYQYAVNHYTVIGNRTLERYELVLNEKQKKDFIDHLKISIKNFKTNYYFFNRNCGSILVKLIGESLNDKDIASYNAFASPPNSLLSLLKNKKVIKPVFPHIYSYTSRAQIASDMILKKLNNLKEKNRKIIFPSYNRLNSKKDNERGDAYSDLFEIALKEKRFRKDINEIFKLAQISELAYTWNKGVCIQYSTKTKGLVREFIKEFDKKAEEKVDVAELVNKFNRENEIKDSNSGTSHTGLSPFKTGYTSVITDDDKNEWAFISGSIYSQKMGDISNFSMLRGTEVKFGSFEFDYNSEDTGFRFTALKIRKIKERRDYVPSIFSINRKFGIGFTLLNIEDLPDGSNTSKIIPGEIEGFVSLASSRLFLDYLIAGIGLSLETEGDKGEFPLSEFFNNTTSAGFPVRVESQMTFGENRFLQFELGAEYKPYLLLSGDNNYEPYVSSFSIKSSMDLRIGEYYGTEFIIESSFIHTVFKRKDHSSTEKNEFKTGLKIMFW